MEGCKKDRKNLRLGQCCPNFFEPQHTLTAENFSRHTISKQAFYGTTIKYKCSKLLVNSYLLLQILSF